MSTSPERRPGCCRAAWRAVGALLMLLCTSGCVPVAHAQDPFAAQRRQMVEDIAAMARTVGSATGAGAIDARVMQALSSVPRHEFVPPDQRTVAYRNRPLPIGHGQTISQPYIVAVMTELLQPKPGDRVLEIGTGSGYQAAILAQMGAAVFTVEIVEPLAQSARDRLARLGYAKVQVRFGDGYHGWEQHAPYDAIIVTAAATHVPPPLIRQLKPGARMVIPVGAPFLAQHLMLVEKQQDGSVLTRQLLPVRFVPLTGGH